MTNKKIAKVKHNIHVHSNLVYEMDKSIMSHPALWMLPKICCNVIQFENIFFIICQRLNENDFLLSATYQCDQIRRFLKVLVDKLNGDFLGKCEKHYF